MGVHDGPEYAPKEIVGVTYTVESIANCRQFNIWKANQNNLQCAKSHPIVDPDPNRFLERIIQLLDLGLLVVNPVVFDSKEGEVLFELQNPFTKESLFSIAHSASCVLCGEEIIERETSDYDYVFPLESHLKKAVVVGVLAPRYLQNTTLIKSGYLASTERFESTKAAMRHIKEGVNIKGISRLNQRPIKDRSKKSQRNH